MVQTSGTTDLMKRFEARLDADVIKQRMPSLGGGIGNITSRETQAALIELQELVGGARVLEIGSYFGNTTRVMAEVAARTGGKVVTVDPYGGHRIPGIIASWPKELQAVTEFHPVSSMNYFMMLDDKKVPRGADAPFDIVFVDGNHAFEYAMFDVLMSASYLKPGGAMVIDNINQSGPAEAAALLVERYKLWKPLLRGDRHPLEAIHGTNGAILFAPPGVELGEFAHKMTLRGLEAPELSELRLPLKPMNSEGVLRSVNNLCFFAHDNYLKGDGLFSTVHVQETKIAKGADVAVLKLDKPLHLDVPKDRPGVIHLELELTYRSTSGGNLLMDVGRDLELV